MTQYKIISLNKNIKEAKKNVSRILNIFDDQKCILLTFNFVEPIVATGLKVFGGCGNISGFIHNINVKNY